MKVLLKVPIINDKIKAAVREQMIQGFGGNFYEVIIGGAAFNQEVEKLLKSIDFLYTVGYGMTECGPIISMKTGNVSNRVLAEKQHLVWKYVSTVPTHKI